MIASSRAPLRGQPLIALATILVAWIALRIAAYDPVIEPQLYAKQDITIEPRSQWVKATLSGVGKPPTRPVLRKGGGGVIPRPIPHGVLAPPPFKGGAGSRILGFGSCEEEEEGSCGQVLERALPPLVSHDFRNANVIALNRAPFAKQRAWSFDAWLLVRTGFARTNSFGLGASTFGGSQTGAVLRFALDADSPTKPVAYMRAVRSLDDADDGHLAVGMGAKPIAAVPIDVHLEGRAYLKRGNAQIAPAAFVSGGIDEVVPQLGASVRGYAQAGYVGGRPDTYFLDGSMVLGKKMPISTKAAMTIGAGGWGGGNPSRRHGWRRCTADSGS